MRMLKKGVRAEYCALIQKFRLIDDTFFNVCFDNYIEGMQLLLRIFFGRDDLVVKHVVAQRSKGRLTTAKCSVRTRERSRAEPGTTAA